MRILLVDDHKLFRDGLKFLLEDLATELIFEEAGSPDEMETVPDPHSIDLVLLDHYFPGKNDPQDMSGLARARNIFEAAVIVVISGENSASVIEKAINEGAAGWIIKDSSPQILVTALKLVLAGGTYLPNNTLKNSPESRQQKSPLETANASAINNLSARQKDVLMRAIQGKANKVIARELDITDHTVKAHLGVAFKILGVQNRTQAVYLAAQLGLFNT